MITLGTHPCRGVKAEFIEAGEKKTPGITVTLKLLDTDDLIDCTLWLSEGAKVRSAKSLALLGFDGENLETITSKDAECEIGEEEYEGKKYTRVKWINDPNYVGGFAKMDPGKKQSVMSELRGLVLSQKRTEKAAEENFGGKKPKF